MRILLLFLLIFPVLGSESTEIKKQMIKESIARYKGACACPYSRTKSGRKCGKRSAYSKPGGDKPICYESDISDAKLKKYNLGK